MPILDTRTLTVVVAAVAIVLMGAQALSWRIHTGVAGNGHWALMTLGFGSGFALLASRDLLPASLAVVLANLLVLGGAVMGLEGTRRFQGRPRWPTALWVELGLLGLVAVLQIYFTYVEPSYRARVVLVSSAAAAGLGAIVWVLVRGGARQTRTMRYATSIPFAFVSVLLLFRARHYAIHDDVGAGFMASTRWQSATFLAVIVCTVAWTLGLILLAAQQVQIELRRTRDDLERLASTDVLTSIANRRGLLEAAEAELARAQRYQHDLAIIMFDLDHFKKVNDTHGHATGDEVLAGAVERCRRELRGHDVFGRLGGEEFAILLPETDTAGATKLAERLCQALADAPIPTEAGPITTTASFGVSSIRCGEATVAAMIACADEGVYRAKDDGRNRVAVCDDIEALTHSERHEHPQSQRHGAMSSRDGAA